MSRRTLGSSRRLGRLLALAPLIVLLASPVGPRTAAADPPSSTYTNPMKPQVPGDGVVESCADPTVFKGRQAGDRYWYMFCTTDPLNDQDRNAAGDLNFHIMPMMRSLDLVTWTYVGDAFSSLPALADPGARLWAPK